MRMVRLIMWMGLAVVCQLALAQTDVPRVAIFPWTFAENEKGTNMTAVTTAQDTLRRFFEQRGGYEVISEVRCRAVWREMGYPEPPLTVENPTDLPRSFDEKRLLAFGRRLGADYVCAGTLGWRVRSVWVTLGPKTKADATVSLIIIDVKNGEVVHEVKELNSASTRAERWYETAGALLVNIGITAVSGGPKTPQMQNAAVKAIGAALDDFFVQKTRRKIEETSDAKDTSTSNSPAKP